MTAHDAKRKGRVLKLQIRDLITDKLTGQYSVYLLDRQKVSSDEDHELKTCYDEKYLMLSIAYNGLKIRVRSSIDFVPGPAFIEVHNQTPVKINSKSGWETTRQLWSGCISVALILSLRSLRLCFLTFFSSTFLKKYPGAPLCHDTPIFTFPDKLKKKKPR